MPKTRDLKPSQKLELIQQPYLRLCEIRDLLGKPQSTTERAIKNVGLKKYPPLGYLTDDVIEAFNLGGAIKRWKSIA